MKVLHLYALTQKTKSLDIVFSILPKNFKYLNYNYHSILEQFCPSTLNFNFFISHVQEL